MGGGIGSAYAGLGDCGEEQSILLLEPPGDLNSLARVESAGFQILSEASPKAAEAELRRADVVVFSWYHHPALTRFLRELPAVPIRSVLWSHVFGSYFPHIPTAFLLKFDQIAFTTPLSLQMPQVRRLGEPYIREHANIVYGLNDLSCFIGLSPRPHPHFTVGYVGTLNFFKLHPDFVQFCAAVKIPDVRFLIVGESTTKEALLAAARQKGIAHQFQFCGHLPDVTQALAQMDVFGYPLNPEHSGTTENALLEAMAAGLPAVALDQCVERYIVKDGETGRLVRSPQEYGEAVELLYKNPAVREEMGRKARRDIQSRFDIAANRERFLNACRRAMQSARRVHRFDDFFAGEPADWFLTCVKEDRGCFLENRAADAGWFFHERTKGSPIHYHSYFPEDKRLALWTRQLLENQNTCKLI